MASLMMLCILNVQAVSTGLHTFTASSKLATGTWLKISLDGTEDGIYQITYDQLTKMGFSNPEQVGVYGFGGHPLHEAVNSIIVDDLPEVATYHDTANRRPLLWSRHPSMGLQHDTRFHSALEHLRHQSLLFPTPKDRRSAHSNGGTGSRSWDLEYDSESI